MATEAVEQTDGTNGAATEEFMGKVLEDFAGMTTTWLCALGERHGLFRALADAPATSEELAARTNTNERYVREWLRALTASEYLHHDRDSGRFVIPAEHVPVLAEERGPYFFGGGFQMSLGFLPVVERVSAAFKHGGGAAQPDYGEDTWEGMERFTAGWLDHLLLQDWIPALPHVREKLEDGARFADVGCGAGGALIKLAGEYPRSSFVGYDLFEGQVALARRNVAEAGLEGRIELRVADAVKGLDETFDVVSTFDVVHDAADPEGLMRGIRGALADHGSYLMLEMKSADDPADNVGLIPSFLYGASVFYCMTTSLAQEGVGLGTCGMPEAKVRELAGRVGFGDVTVAPISEDPFNVLYELRP